VSRHARLQLQLDPVVLSAAPARNFVARPESILRALATWWPCSERAMNSLAKVLIFKISATLLFWSLPFVFFPSWLLEKAGFPHQESYVFVRLLGWAYLALCAGYGFALRSALHGKRALGPIWVGIISNGGACGILAFYGATGAWSTWGPPVQWVCWGSTAATFLITLGLVVFGVRGDGVEA
jgi:hypothetical protein